MKDGFIKVASVSPVLKVADCDKNADVIIESYIEAAKKDVKLLVMPEMAITAYTVGELVSNRALLVSVEKALLKIREATRGYDTLLVVGFPFAQNGAIYNCAAVITDGSILGIVPKTAITCGGENYDGRYFTPAPDFNTEITLGGEIVTFGKKQIFACEQNPEFTVGVEIGDDLFAVKSPSLDLALEGATVIACPMAKSELVGREEKIRDTVKMHSDRLNCAYITANAGIGESSSEGAFSGYSLIAENGKVLAESKPFVSEMLVTDIDVQILSHDRIKDNLFVGRGDFETVFFTQAQTETKLSRVISDNPFMPVCGEEREKRCERILDIQAHALARRVSHIRSKKIVIGISGGLDSTLALIVMARAMDILKRPRTDIIAITLPCFGTTKRTKSNAQKMCEMLGVDFKEINIGASVTQHLKDIGHELDNFDVTYENAQARERTQVLMDVANKVGGIVIGTGDLSEAALGWATYNGDHMSMYSVNCDVPKTLVRILVSYYADTCGNSELKEIFYDVLGTPVSPELIPPKDGEIVQVTEDLVGPYELHDFFLYHFIRYGFTAEKIFRMAKIAFAEKYREETISKWLSTFFRRFVMQQFKRSCSPDGVRVGNVALTPSVWRMPSDTEGEIFKL